ncbi:hypothetical protein KM043_010462 [Ampulex compressa]|nr:hypothetical protein KM043_010462 [Ampulex compressa]
MSDNIKENPFIGLFSTVNDAVSFSSQQPVVDEDRDDDRAVSPSDKLERDVARARSPSSKAEREDGQLDDLLENVFGLTLHDRSNVPKELVFIDTDSIEHAIFERLMLSDPRSKLVSAKGSKSTSCEEHTVEGRPVRYLFESYRRLQLYPARLSFSDTINDVRKIILRNVGTALQEPDLFQGQEVYEQFVALFVDDAASKAELSSFVHGLVNELCADDRDDAESIVAAAFAPILDIVREDVKRSNLSILRQYWFALLQLFSTVEPLAKLVISHGTLERANGLAYENTLLGALLSLNCLPKTMGAPFDFFEKPLQQSSAATEGNIWTALDALQEALQKIFHSLLKCSTEVRGLTLSWIGNCLCANANRGKLWNGQNNNGFGTMSCVSDGFMLNLGNVLLRLCQPFCAKPCDSSAPKIDPTYCAAEVTDAKDGQARGVHLSGMATETCLIPAPEGRGRPVAKSFAFITECFFFTHRALDLGYRVVLDKFQRTSQDLARIQRVYNDAQTGGSMEVLEGITQRMEMEMSKYLSLRASLLAPEMLNLLAKFHATTALWLVQVNLEDLAEEEEESNREDYMPRQCKEPIFPLPELAPDTLSCIPEFLVENTIEFLCVLRRLSPNTFEEQGLSFLNPVLTEIIVLMESERRLYNPHLRARLAEGLEALLPTNDESVTTVTANLGTFHRQQLFSLHPHRRQIVVNLLHVFVSIEMTGQSVQFEQKFNYRRPMYVIMEYLWKLAEHRSNFISLAEEAEANMEAVQPPLFLRFINLLMNDAVFLLDEALSNMAQLRQMIHARESGEWDKLPQHERDQQAGYLQHVGMIARFDNVLGRKTIQALKMLTTEIKSIFCHSTMVDRIASMLNYLLLQLVGPNKRNLKVKDQKEYGFNPANLVLNICEIYINLSKSESFTLAVSQDGRSYGPELFTLADNVLVRIGGVGILGDLDRFAKSVMSAANQKREEEEILMGAPEEFLDPIMSTLMADPVILPSSKITVDRQTIARHLLSDQTDPFNRSALTMDMVKSDTELRDRIREWISRKKGEMPSSSRQ